MKIIKRADSEVWLHKFTCNECESELEADADDLCVQHYDGDYRDPSYDVWSVSCPICSHSTSIREDKIPKVIRVKSKQKTQSYSGRYDR